MPDYFTYLLAILLSTVSFLTIANDVPPQTSSQHVVLEATSKFDYNGYQSQFLLVRLTDDGKVEWDKPVAPRASERQTSSVSAERVSEIKRTLDAVHLSSLHGSMGPYETLPDASVELRIHMTSEKGEVTFSVINPWVPSGARHCKRMPKNVKVVICEIDRLHSQLAGDPLNEICKPTKP
jgi:hypothetical protein